MRWPRRAGWPPAVRDARGAVGRPWSRECALAQVYTDKYTLWRQHRPGQGGAMTTRQLEFTEAELLSTHEVHQPLVAGGVRCHGGVTHDGTDVSPPTKFRAPAIEAWQEHHPATFRRAVVHPPLHPWPHNLPDLQPASLLIP